jgi:arylformamidase
MANTGWIDISVPLRDDMVHWTGDPAVQVVRVSDVERGDSHTLSKISMGSHTGTHVDAPLHFIKKGIGIDEMPLNSLVGRARVLEIKDSESIKLSELTDHGIRRGERILFKTRNSELWQSGRFEPDFVFLTNEAAEFLAQRHVRVVGVDYLSVGEYRHGGYPHKILLGAGTWILEGLDLSQIGSGSYYMVCLPLRLEHGDGAPARAIIRPLK